MSGTIEVETTPHLLERGHWAAKDFIYHRRDMDILEEFWSSGEHQIDFIAKEDDDLVFIKVHTSDNTEEGFSYVPNRKALEQIAIRYLIEVGCASCRVRFDVVEIISTGDNRSLLRYHVNALVSAETR